MFHVFFLEKFAKPLGKTLDDVANELDRLYGRPNNQLKEEFLETVKAIKAVSSWEYVIILETK
jgi:hypothetical protein